LRCQRSNVVGVTKNDDQRGRGSSLDNVANTTRSTGSRSGRRPNDEAPPPDGAAPISPPRWPARPARRGRTAAGPDARSRTRTTGSQRTQCPRAAGSSRTNPHVRPSDWVYERYRHQPPAGKGDFGCTTSMTNRVGARPTAPTRLVVFHCAASDESRIVRRLDLSEKTICNIVSNIFSKLPVAGRAEANLRARDAGLGR